MPVYSQFFLKPTFPLDEFEIGRRSFWRKAQHPASWGILGACLVAGIALQGGLWPVLAMMTAGIFGVQWFWRDRSNQVLAEVIQELITESNRDQDRKLRGIVCSYRDRGMHHYAAALGKFLLLKQHIEESLHAGRNGHTVTPTVEQVEKLVDNVCGAVCREFHQAASLDGKLAEVLVSRDPSKLERLQGNRTEVLEAIMHAYETLDDSLEAILDLETARDASARDFEAETRRRLDRPSLNEAVEKLRDENRLARRVSERLAISEAARSEPNHRMFSGESMADREMGSLFDRDHEGVASIN